jgi:uncharacterized cupin superfamily protein
VYRCSQEEKTMEIRRLVVGTNESGASYVVSDGVAPNHRDFAHTPLQGHTRLWFSDRTPSAEVPMGEPTDNTGPIAPGPGGTAFMIIQYAPLSVFTSDDFDAAASAKETSIYSPDIMAAMAEDEGGMHTTRTVDYGVVLDGEIHLEVDGGDVRALRRGDTFIQLGARHAWRNFSDAPATVAVFLIGKK